MLPMFLLLLVRLVKLLDSVYEYLILVMLNLVLLKGLLGGMRLNLIVSVPDHCLSSYFVTKSSAAQ